MWIESADTDADPELTKGRTMKNVLLMYVYISHINTMEKIVKCVFDIETKV